MWTIGALTGNDMVEAAVSKVQSLSDLIGRRSPGARTEGQLTKTKHARALARQRIAPRQHVAAAVPAPKGIELAQLFDAPVILPAVVSVENPPPLAELTAPPPTLGGIIVPGSNSPPGESPPVSFPGPESKTPLTPSSPLPEPGTWATMLLGFGLIGWQVRRSKRPQRKPVVA